MQLLHDDPDEFNVNLSFIGWLSSTTLACNTYHFATMLSNRPFLESEMYWQIHQLCNEIFLNKKKMSQNLIKFFQFNNNTPTYTSRTINNECTDQRIYCKIHNKKKIEIHILRALNRLRNA